MQVSATVPEPTVFRPPNPGAHCDYFVQMDAQATDYKCMTTAEYQAYTTRPAASRVDQFALWIPVIILLVIVGGIGYLCVRQITRMLQDRKWRR